MNVTQFDSVRVYVRNNCAENALTDFDVIIPDARFWIGTVQSNGDILSRIGENEYFSLRQDIYLAGKLIPGFLAREVRFELADGSDYCIKYYANHSSEDVRKAFADAGI